MRVDRLHAKLQQGVVTLPARRPFGRGYEAAAVAFTVILALGALFGCEADRSSAGVVSAVGSPASGPPASFAPRIAAGFEARARSTGLDLGAVMRRVRVGFRERDAGHEGGDATYGVRVTRGRIAITARHFPSGAASDPRTPARAATLDEPREGSALTLETLSVRRAEAFALATRAPSTTLGDQGELLVDRGRVQETLRNGEQGLEQSWRFAERPSGGGDLAIRVAAHGQTYRGKTDQGLHFIGTKHGVGVRYGHATWIGAHGEKTAVEARWRQRAIELVVPAAIVDATDYPAVLDPVVSPELGMDEPVLGPSIGPSESVPQAASDGDGTSLVVWCVNGDIWGARVTSDGSVLDHGGIAIATDFDTQSGPSVSFGSTGWLVTWIHGGTDQIYARRISAAGAVLDADPIVMPTGSNWLSYPVASYSDGNWLVVWAEWDVHGARVSEAGELLDSSRLTISSEADEARNPSVSNDGSNWFVTWWDTGTGSDIELHGVRVSPTGAVLDAPELVMGSSPSYAELDSGISHNGTNWLVTWVDDRGETGSDIYAARVSSSGTLLDPSGVPIHVGEDYQGNPAASSDGTNWLVTWRDSAGVHATRVSPSGTVLDPSGIDVSNVEAGEGGPAVTHDGANWLVVWVDSRTGTSAETYGARITSAGTVVDTVPILVSASANAQEAPAIAYDGTNWLVVWADYRSGTHDDIYGVRVSPTGTILDPSGIAIATVAEDQSAPAVGHDGTNWLVAWADHRSGTSSDIYAARVSPAGAVLDPSGMVTSNAAEDQDTPSVATGSGSCLVTWRDYRNGTSYGIWGSRVSATQGLLDASGIAIAPDANATYRPSAAFNGTHWLVVWEDYGSTTVSDVYGRRVSPAGQLLEASNIPISTATVSQYWPSVASDGTSWLVVWGDRRNGVGNHDIFGTRVSADGAVLDASGIPICTASESQSVPAVAHDGTHWVVIWRDARGSTVITYDPDISSTRVDADGAVLDGTGRGISFEPVPEDEPTIAAGPPGMLLVAYHSSAGPNSRVRARLFDAECAIATRDTTCDGVDDDCDGSIDEDFVRQRSSCGEGLCQSMGEVTCADGEVTDTCEIDPTDTDGDSVPDCADKCPYEPGVAPDGCEATGSGGSGGSSATGGSASSLGGRGSTGGSGGTAATGGTAGPGGSGVGGSTAGGSDSGVATGGSGQNGDALAASGRVSTDEGVEQTQGGATHASDSGSDTPGVPGALAGANSADVTNGGAASDLEGKSGANDTDDASSSSGKGSKAPDAASNGGAGPSRADAGDADSDEPDNAAGAGHASSRASTDDEGGCGCRVGGTKPGMGSLGLMLVGLLVLRRRRGQLVVPSR